MNHFDAISLGISIGLGLLSIGLAIFAIWLSYKFSESSRKALDAVSELSRETRTLVELNLDQQKNFSGKMLDSIIEQNKFGNPNIFVPNSKTDTVSDVVINTLKDVEEKINKSVEKELRKFAASSTKNNKDLQSVIEAIKNDISTLNDAAPVISSAIKLPDTLQKVLLEFQKLPAHYVVLQSILLSGATSINDLEKVKKQYFFPKGWEDGVDNLVTGEILKETDSGFEIYKENIIPLKAWVERNSTLLNELIEIYKVKDNIGVSNAEIQIANKFKF